MIALDDYAPLPRGESQYPLEYIETNGAIKLSESESLVTVGITEEDDGLKDELEDFHNKPVRFLNIDKGHLSAYLARNNSGSPLGTAVEREGGGHTHNLDKLANDAPIVNLVNSVIMDAISRGASDIHIESFSDRVTVRFRIDGILVPEREVEKHLFPAVSSRIKIMANMNIMERRLPQDGRVSVKMAGRDVDLRVSVVPISGGESIVLRLLNKQNRLLSLEEMGFSSGTINHLRQLSRRPHGLILLSGPTGSGKTTTLNSIIKEINNPSVKIITIEDPVEYEIDGVDQIQTNEKINLTFESILRRVLRQDPNIIMVGEIRDGATAELAVRASMTGHLVLSTVHTNDAVSVLHRMINMGVEPYLLAGVLRGALAQRLVRRLCPECRIREDIGATERQILKENGLEAGKLYRAVGCPSCGGTGFHGRIALSESFLCDEKMEDLISKAVPASQIRQYLLGEGMVPLYRDGLEKAVGGLTTIGEVEKAVLL